MRLSKEGRRFRRLIKDAVKRKLRVEKQPWYKAFCAWACGPEGNIYEKFITRKRLWEEFPLFMDFVLSMSDVVDIQDKQITRLERRVAKLERRK